MKRKKNIKKAQIALEYLIVLGVIIALLTPLVYSQIHKYIIKQRINNANQLAHDIARSADSLYSLGPGNQKYLYITVPKGVTDVNIYQREITFTVATAEGEYQEIVLLTDGYVTGVIPITAGVHHIPMQVLQNGVVLIGYPYCSIQHISNCTEGGIFGDMNPILYISGNYNAHVSQNISTGDPLDTGYEYSVCCKNTVEIGTGQGAATMFWINNELSSHAYESDISGDFFPASIRPIDPEINISCEIINESFDFCQELGSDYYCIATLEDKYYYSTDGEWDGNMLYSSHVSDCDSDWDDFPIRLCCIIPPG